MKPRKFTTPEGVVVTVTMGRPGETLFPEKLANANETLAKMEAMSFSVKDLFERIAHHRSDETDPNPR